MMNTLYHPPAPEFIHSWCRPPGRRVSNGCPPLSGTHLVARAVARGWTAPVRCSAVWRTGTKTAARWAAAAALGPTGWGWWRHRLAAASAVCDRWEASRRACRAGRQSAPAAPPGPPAPSPGSIGWSPWRSVSRSRVERRRQRGTLYTGRCRWEGHTADGSERCRPSVELCHRDSQLRAPPEPSRTERTGRSAFRPPDKTEWMALSCGHELFDLPELTGKASARKA